MGRRGRAEASLTQAVESVGPSRRPVGKCGPDSQKLPEGSHFVTHKPANLTVAALPHRLTSCPTCPCNPCPAPFHLLSLLPPSPFTPPGSLVGPVTDSRRGTTFNFHLSGFTMTEKDELVQRAKLAEQAER